MLLTDDDLAPLQPKKSKEIDLETFVPVADVNPMMFDSSYLVLPDKNAKPYALLAEAMADSGRVGIGRFVMRQKEYLAAIRSDGSHLTLSTLVFPDELVAPDSIEEFEQFEGVEVSDKELKMAKGLVDALSDDFDPAQYTDEYRAAVEKIIEEKAAGALRCSRTNRRRGPRSSTSPRPSRPASPRPAKPRVAIRRRRPPAGQKSHGRRRPRAAAADVDDADEAPKTRKTRARKSA